MHLRSFLAAILSIWVFMVAAAQADGTATAGPGKGTLVYLVSDVRIPFWRVMALQEFWEEEFWGHTLNERLGVITNNGEIGKSGHSKCSAPYYAEG
ncbi:hypothetical protein Mmc1_3291 [Magnetococcus marinus MC-1]|uniref:Uncharacterized protein n=1 Tax=Magnetococcus marinus (strain ATCC BAA-1437 / JCM 17883 / MC-1) TaxID=156889 RepID=A0LCT7_MAGMM|nr:hypothetical protein Mmc1_3291 [Magnetococcus marinus MC-1]